MGQLTNTIGLQSTACFIKWNTKFEIFKEKEKYINLKTRKKILEKKKYWSLNKHKAADLWHCLDRLMFNRSRYKTKLNNKSSLNSSLNFWNSQVVCTPIRFQKQNIEIVHFTVTASLNCVPSFEASLSSVELIGG